MDQNWFKEFNGAITVCSETGEIVYLNDKSIKTFESDGGASLIGKSLFDCHPEAANNKLKDLIKNKKTNCYTIEKNGIKKLIYQSPWFENNIYKGIIELSIPLPQNLEHFKRD